MISIFHSILYFKIYIVNKIVKVYVCVVALPEMVWEDNTMWEGERGEGGEGFTQPDGQTHGEWREGSSP